MTNPPQYPAGVSDKSKVVAGILGILLGSFGAGRFYIGDTKTGTLQIVATVLTCGIGGLWGFIDGILLLVKGGVDARAAAARLNDTGCAGTPPAGGVPVVPACRFAQRASGVPAGRSAAQPASRARAAASRPADRGSVGDLPGEDHRDGLVEVEPGHLEVGLLVVALVPVRVRHRGQLAGQEHPDQLVGEARRGVHVDQQVAAGRRPGRPPRPAPGAAAAARSSPDTSISPAGSSHMRRPTGCRYWRTSTTRPCVVEGDHRRPRRRAARRSRLAVPPPGMVTSSVSTDEDRAGVPLGARAGPRACCGSLTRSEPAWCCVLAPLRRPTGSATTSGTVDGQLAGGRCSRRRP